MPKLQPKDMASLQQTHYGPTKRSGQPRKPRNQNVAWKCKRPGSRTEALAETSDTEEWSFACQSYNRRNQLRCNTLILHHRK